ncbi:hypothetical protein OH77DRAFT_1487968 [Trametes cingulata]|nr:hypothetical protein OH77DRAFT_1487968 [Trametes cingulata]
MPLHDVLRQRFQPLTSAVTSNRIFLYSVFSTFAVAATIANACRAHSNFYSVSIYLSKSSRSVLVLANFGFLCALLCGRIFQRIFFGTLQPREVERLYDQTWMFVTESLLAFTIFRDEFDVPFLLMFGFLLFVKCFHWLMADRVESMDQTPYPGPPSLFHIRINALFAVLWAIDITMFAFAVESTLANGVGGMVLFASEYAILLASSLNAMLRYALSILDLRRARTRGGENAPPWENKSMYIFYIELLTDFLKLATYMTFFMIILTFYGLPLNIIRDVFVTARSFITRLRALIRYHNATRDMDRRYPDATEAELAEMSDRTCIICREEMQSRNAPAPADNAANGDEQQQQQATPLPPADGPNMTPKKLPCGHIFHFQCLRSWLERQQSCPTCRRTVLDNNAPQNARQAPGQGQGQPPAARPGAVPVPGPALQVQPGVAAAGNGPLGWVGRFLGVPQAPVLNGHFPGPQGPFPPPGAPQPPFQQHALPNGWGGAPGQVPPQPGAFYDPMHGWQQPPPQPLQPPPVFNGFYGPGQLWQAWGDPRLLGQQPPAPAQPQPRAEQQEHQHEAPAAPPPAQVGQIPRPPSTAAPTAVGDAPTMRQTADSQAPTPTPTSPPSSSEPTTVDESTVDARRAAALAALRRLNPSVAATQTTQPSEPSPSARPANAATTPSSAGPFSTPSTSTAAPPAPSTTAPASPVPPAPASDTAGHPPPAGAPILPSLIPLYDTSIVQPTRVPGTNPFHAPYTHYYRTSNSRPALQASQRSSASGQTSQNQVPRSARAGPGGSRTPLGQLPPTLTDEQLARLDRLTREAIDERLRVLEGVSGAIYRCMEELTRVRSVLPSTAARRPAPGTQAQSREASSSSPSTSTPTPASSANSSSPDTPSAGPGASAQPKDTAPEPVAASSGSATPSEDESVLSDETGEAAAMESESEAREGVAV